MRQLLTSLPQVTPQLSEEQRVDLRNLSAFRGKTMEQENLQYNAVNLLLIDSVRAARSEDADVGAALAAFYSNERINIGVRGIPHVDIETRHDGSSQTGDESINIYNIPTLALDETRFDLYASVGYKFASDLTDQGHWALQTGYQDRPLQDATDSARFGHALYSQKDYVLNMARDRHLGTMDVMAGIATTLEIPETATGFSRFIGRSILRDETLDDDGKRDAANSLSAYIGSVELPKVSISLSYNSLALRASELYLDNKFPGFNSHTEPVMPASTWNFSWLQDSGEYAHVTIQGGGGSLDENDPNNPFLTGYNSIMQYGGRTDGTVATEEIVVPEVDYISAGYYWDKKLIIGGWSASASLSRFYGYEDTNDDGFVEADTRQLLFETDMFSHGTQIVNNEARDQLNLFDLGTRNLYQLNTPSNGFPDAFSHAGGLGDTRWDVVKAGFSEDGNWAIGYNLGVDYGLQPETFRLEARYIDESQEYEPIRVAFAYEEVEEKPAVAEVPWSGSLTLRATYTPNTEFSTFKWVNEDWNPIGTAQTDPFGRAIFELDEPIEAGARYRVGSLDDQLWSSVYLGVNVDDGPTLDDPRLKDDYFKIGYFYIPGTEVVLETKPTLRQEWTPLESKITQSFGKERTRLDISGQGKTGFFRARVQERAAFVNPVFFALAPVAAFTFYPAWTSHYAAPSVTFALTEISQSSGFLAQPGMGSLTSRLLMIGNPFGVLTTEYKLQQAALTDQLNQVLLFPEYAKILFPPVMKNDDGVEVVKIFCLIINDEKYPLFQFALRPPDNCIFIHWHSPFFSRVFHLGLDKTGIQDPDLPFCGYGTILERVPAVVEVPFAEWRDFVSGFFLGGLPGSIVE